MKKHLGLWAAAAIAVGAFILPTARTASASTLATYVQDRDHDRDDHRWEAPPGELDEFARRGYHDGVEGARKDWGNHRRPDVENREEFRHPPVRGRDRRAYRDGFRRGYQAGVQHLEGWVR